jgi:hypothetical protein
LPMVTNCGFRKPDANSVARVSSWQNNTHWRRSIVNLQAFLVVSPGFSGGDSHWSASMIDYTKSALRD